MTLETHKAAETVAAAEWAKYAIEQKDG